MTSTMPPSSALSGGRQSGFLEQLQTIPADQLLMMGMTGPSMNTLKKSQSAIDCKHPCVYQYGSCSFGDECKFAEIDGKVCAKFLKGGCAWGNNCCWKHTTVSKATSQAREMAQQQQQQQQPRRNNGRRFEEQNQDDMYLQSDLGFGNDMQQRNIFQQLQMQQPQLNNLQGNLMGNDISLPGMQNFGGLDDTRCFSEQLQQALPFQSMGDEETLTQSQVAQLMTTIVSSIKDFDDRHNVRVSQLQMAIEMAEKERNEEGDRNRRSISALMSSVDHLMGKLKDLGIPVGGAGMQDEMMHMAQTPMQPTQMTSPVNTGTSEKSKAKTCLHCGKGGRLMLCGRCKLATFCNQQCQREAWSTHSKTCTPPSRPAES